MPSLLPVNVIAFSNGDTSIFDQYLDMWNQYRSEHGTKKYTFATTDHNGKTLTYADKEASLNAAILRKVGEMSGVDFSKMSMEQASTHPLVNWSVMALASQMIDAILPNTLIDSIGAYAEVRTIGYGETAVFDIASRDLFPVGFAGRGQREGQIYKGTEGQVTLNPERRIITVGVNMWRVLTGQESLAKFTIKALRSIETEMNKDVYNAFYAAMTVLSTTASTGLRVTGYTQADLIKLSQKVSAFSGGATPILLGTKAALNQVLPDDGNYRYDIDSPYVTLGYVRTIAGITTMELPQVADWTSPFATLLTDSYLWLVAPSTDKIVKVVIGGATISNTNGMFDNANLTQNATLMKSWKAGIVTSSVAGTISL